MKGVFNEKQNSKLHIARKSKVWDKDEFYTPRRTIEKELSCYNNDLFKGKSVLCNCDAPAEDENDDTGSRFIEYFLIRFKDLGLRKLAAIHYGDKNVQAYKQIFTADKRGYPIKRGRVALCGNGDFRSPESIALLEDSDIVVTNPPFSLFREFFAQLIKYKKKFIIIGNLSAITYKDVFKFIQKGKVTLGGTPRCQEGFIRPNQKMDDEQNYDKVPACWYTNLPRKLLRNNEIQPSKLYSPELYPKYDNYNAIEVSKTKDIPADYDGEMGVPTTYLEKANSKMFKIVWCTDRGGDGKLEYLKIPHQRDDTPVVNGEGVYKRIIIKRKGNKK